MGMAADVSRPEKLVLILFVSHVVYVCAVDCDAALGFILLSLR